MNVPRLPMWWVHSWRSSILLHFFKFWHEVASKLTNLAFWSKGNNFIEQLGGLVELLAGEQWVHFHAQHRLLFLTSDLEIGNEFVDHGDCFIIFA